jgi:hypothetical protein
MATRIFTVGGNHAATSAGKQAARKIKESTSGACGHCFWFVNSQPILGFKKKYEGAHLFANLNLIERSRCQGAGFIDS